MAGKTINLDDIITKDQLGCHVSNLWLEWNMYRQTWIEQKKELRSYIYATDTTTTTNSSLPWSNKTTIPKLTQIRDNLYANYIATMYPKRRWLNWEGSDKSDETRSKTKVIKDYMSWVVSQPQFKQEIEKLVLDYIDYGNAFATTEWVDETYEKNGISKPGYVGPRIVRVSPLDIVMNPVAASFNDSPKIIRMITNVGEAREMLEKFSLSESEKELAEGVFKYCRDLRTSIKNHASGTELATVDQFFAVDGFTNFRQYLDSNNVELLFFYGDVYDFEKDEFLKNHLIVVIDRHKILLSRPHPFPLSEIPIRHCGWRVRQDNLWAMGPLDNLVGLQYRLDHIENLKADIFDLTAFPPIMIKGIVNDFTWGPLEKIHVDADGDVELLTTDLQVLQANVEMGAIETRMEEMAGSPKEAMGFRTPGEKTAYEVQRLENAASRIFQNKIAQFEEKIIEPLLNDMLVLAQENMSDTVIRTIQDEFKAANFKTITRDQISANGRIKPVAARHFAERAEMIQNLNNFFSSALGADPEMKVHFSTIKTAKMIEDLIDIERYELVEPYVRVHEAAEFQQQQNTQQEEVMNTALAPAGLTPEDATL